MVIKHDVELGDKVSGPAKAASAAVAGVSREMTLLTKSLTAAQDKMAKAAATGNTKGFLSAQKDVFSLTKTIGTLPPGGADAAKSLTEMGQSAADAKASSAGLQAELAELTGGLSLVAEAAAVVVLGLAAAVVAGAAFAIKMSEAKNASLSLWTALGKGEITGAAVDDMLDELRASTGLTKDALGPLTEGFLRMGVTGKEALASLTVAAASAEAMAKGGGEAFTKLYQQAKVAGETGSKMSIPFKKLENQLVSMGLNVDDLAAQMGMSGTALTAGLKAGTIDAKKFGDAMQEAITKKGAGPLETMANSSANLGKLLQEYIGDLFEDLGKDIAPFMAEVKSLFSILDSKANPSGQALKEGIGAFFKQVFAQATKVVPMIKHFLLDVIIYGLKAYLALKPIIKWVKELAANQEVIDTMKSALKGIGIAALVVVGVIAALVAVAIVMNAVFGLVLGALIWLAVAMIEFPAKAGKALREWVDGAIGSAGEFVSGLVTGITNGAAQVIGAVKGLAGKATGAFKSALGISSPSKVMAQMGDHMGAGLEGGLEAASPGVAKASGAMAGSAMAGASAGASSGQGGGGGGGGISVTFAAGSIVVNGAGKAAEELTEEMMALAFERMALQGGL